MEKAINKRIIWIDKNVNNIENKLFLEIMESGINNAKLYPVESIEEAFKLIENQKETIIDDNNNKREVKVFQFRLFYVIVSGSLSNDFFREYVNATKKLTIISSNIIFCSDEDKHKRNAYYLDDFLNPGKVYSEKTIDKLIEYINRDELTNLKEPSILENKKEYKAQTRNYGNVFFNANNISDIAYPFFFGQLINSTFITDYNLEAFQNFMLEYYPELKYLIFPSKEKKIEIPYYLLAKFYLHMYTYECGFFKNMNLDLSNSKFDLYRVYIFLLYDALNQKSIKSYYENSLYRGTVLSKKELETINNLIAKKSGNHSKINVCLYFTKMFLSFSKNIDVAKSFIHEGNDNLIPVLFEVKGLSKKEIEKNKDFFFSNLDLEYITEFDEEEVLFLPLSSFEIVSVEDETIIVFGDKIKIKRITLKYLYEYKDSLYKFIEGIKKKELFEKFLNDVISSNYSKEIADLIDFDIGNEFKNFIQRKFQLDNKITNFSFIRNIKNKQMNLLQERFNSLFPEEPEFIQKVFVGDKEAILIHNKGGSNIVLRPQNNKVYYKEIPNINEYQPPIVPAGLPQPLKKSDNGDIAHKMVKSNDEYCQGKNDNACDKCMDKVKKHDNKADLEDSYYFEFFAVGYLIGDFIANYDEIKDQPLMLQLKSFGTLAFSCFGPFLPHLCQNYLPEAIFKKMPIVMASVSAFELIISIKDIATDKSLTKSETAVQIFKKIVLTVLQFGASYYVGQIGFKILVSLSIGPGIISTVTAIGLGVAAGYALSKIKKYYEKEDNSEELTLFSESTYNEYIPRKFREYCIPTLCWNGVSKKAKSFALELIEDGYRKWLMINIKKWIRKVHNENYLDVGDTIVDYKGISKHPYKITFILYELKKEKCSPEEWGVGENIKNNYSEEISKYYNQVSVLDVF